MKTCFVTLLALVMGCQPRQLGAADFPTGTYTRCAQGAHNPSGNVFFNAAGFVDGARLTVAQNGTTVTTTYVDQDGLTQSLSFSATTDTVASITRKGQVIPGFTSLCVLGPGKETFHPARMSVTGGALTYDAHMLFLILTGELRSEAGTCGPQSQMETFWVACEDRQGGAVLAAGARAAAVAQLPAGRYSCSTQIETLYHVNGIMQHIGGGATGTLTLMEDGAKVTARYNGDTSLAGTLHFSATTSRTASAEAGQSLMAPCMISKEMGQPSRTPEPLRIAAGSLAMIDSTLFLSFAGAMSESSSCPGAQVAGGVICSK
jgi:hypothetical protein